MSRCFGRMAGLGVTMALAALTALGSTAIAADRHCGTITEVAVSDLPSGGFVIIGDTKFLVGGVQPRNITVSFSDLRVGRSACAEGRFVTIGAPKTFDLYDGSIVLVASLPKTSTGRPSHQASVCGRLLEYVPAPSDDIRHGYAHVRLSTPSGDTAVLFHHTNPTNAASTIQAGATRQGVDICVSGPYVHVIGSSPYVSPYVVGLAPARLPNTSTLP